MSIIYRYGNEYYINMTNRCPCRCVFCLRNTTPAIGDAETLWLDHEPTVDEVIDELRKVDLSISDEIVFCGYGEPTVRFDDLKECARRIKEEFHKTVRVNTNGLGNLINGRDIVPEMEGVIDALSISLNASNEEEYLALSRPSFGPGSYKAMIDFTRESKKVVPNITMSIVGESISPESEKECARIAAELGATFKVRESVCGKILIK